MPAVIEPTMSTVFANPKVVGALCSRHVAPQAAEGTVQVARSEAATLLGSLEEADRDLCARREVERAAADELKAVRRAHTAPIQCPRRTPGSNSARIMLHAP